MRRYSKYYLTSIAILITAWLINGQFASTPVNRWTRSAEMLAQRASACSAQLADGRVLVAGGRNDAAVLSTAEVSGTDGTFTSVAPMSQARAGAACIALPNNRVLVTGGSDANGALATAEVYDASTDVWTSVGTMAAARSGHTATATPWGAVLLVGGEDSGTIELFLTNDTFRTLGKLGTSRANYAITPTTVGHKIVIAGGAHGNSTLSTVEVYDADTGTVSPGGSMLMARRNFAVAPLIDGTVLITGGYGADGKALDKSEIYDPTRGASVAGPAMLAARANHKATVLPSNGSVLLVGGTDDSGVTATTETYTPWTGRFNSAASMHSARQQMVANNLRRGALVVAGGKDSNGALSGSEVYGFATLDTDKADYAPGEQATFTGTGWKPGEQVLLQVSAFPLDQHSVEYTAVTQADSVGRIKVGPFNIDRSHLGVRFLANAKGSESQAQNLFTDAEAVFVSLNLSSPTNPYGSAVTASGHITGSATNPVNLGTAAVAVDGAAAYCSISLAVLSTGDYICPTLSSLNPGNHSFVTQYTGDGAIWNAGPTASSAHSYQVTADTVTTLNTPANATSAVLGTSIAFTATVAGQGGAPNPTTGTVNFINVSGGGAIIASGPVGAGGNASANLATLPGGAYTFGAIYVPATNNGYNSSVLSATKTYTVSKVSPTTVTTSASPVSPTVGQQVSITSCVTTVGGFTPTGTIRFNVDGSAVSGDLAMSGGCATIQYSLLQGGARNLSSVYLASGDPNYNNANNNAAPTVANVAKAVTVGAATSNPLTPVGFGTPITLMGTVTSTATAATGFLIGGAGNATFRDGGVAVACTVAQPLAVVNGSVSCVLNSNLAVGTHAITLDYGSGGVSTDGNFAASVSPAYNLVIGNVTTVTSLSSNQSSIALGGNVTYTANVVGTPTAAGFPTGSIAFKDAVTTDVPGCAAVALVATVTPGTSQAVCGPKTYDGTATLGAGVHQITAVLSPTGSFAASTSGPVSLTVTKPSAVAGSLTLTPTASPISYNTADTVRAVFSPVGGGPALGGTVCFYDGASLISSPCPAVVSGGNTDLALPNSVIQSAGTHTLTAQYSGDANYAASIAPFPTTVLVVNKATPVITPSANDTKVYGASKTFTATVTSGAGTPTGTITWTSGAITIGSVTLPTTNLTVNLTMLPIAVNPVTVTYSGDSNFATATDATTTMTVNQAATNGTVISAPAVSAAFAAPVTLTASFGPTAPSVSGTLTGTVDFKDGVSTLNAAPVTISGGQASFLLSSPLSPGAHNLTAVYNGSGNFATSTTPTYVLTIGAATTTTVVTPSTTSPAVGATVTYLVTVTPAANGPIAPTGPVAIRDSNTDTQLCTFTLTNPMNGTGSCNVVYSGTPVETAPGPHNVKAVYTTNNATNWSSSTSATVGITVGAIASTITTPASSAGGSYAYANTTTFTAVVSPHPGAPNFTGTVQFFDGNTAIGAPIVPNAATGSVTSAPILLAAGTHTITAQFGGDANYGASPVSANLIVTVTKPAVTSTVPGAYTGIYGGTLAGGTFTINAAVGGTTPTGTVTITAGAITFGSLAVAGGVVTPAGAQLPTSLGPVPPATVITFNYSGDSNYAATQFTGTVSITQATPTMTLSSSQNPAALGQSVTFTATVTSPTTGTATGTMAFRDNGVVMTGAGAVPIVNGSASFTTTALTAGAASPHPITAVYSGDTNFATNTSSIVNETINSGNTTITLTPSSATPKLNDVVTYTVVLTGGTTPPQGAASPAVVIKDGATPVCTILGAALTVGATSTTGSCTVTYTGTGVNIAGPHSMTAEFTPLDARWTAATSAVVSVTVAKGTPTMSAITVVPSTPSTCPGQAPTICVPYGTTFGFYVDMTPANPAAAYSASVTFTDNNTTLLGTGPVAVPSGRATMTTPASVLLTGGTHSIKAAYPGDANWNSVDPPVIIIISGLPLGAANFTISANPINTTYGTTIPAGTTVNLTAPAAPPGMATPTGTVTLTVGGVTIGTFPLAAGVAQIGGAALPATLLAGAAQTLTTTYSGDANYSTGNIASNINVAQKVPVVALVSSQNPSNLGQSVTFTVSVTNPAAPQPQAGQPTGTVTFNDNGVPLAAGVILVNGQATYTTTALTSNPPTNHPITAVYSGDTNYTAPTSNTVIQAVNSGTTAIVLTPSSLNPALNSTVTYSVTITGGTTPPQGIAGAAPPAVQVFDGATQVCFILNTSLTVGASSTTGSCTVTYNNTAPNTAGTHNMSARFTPLNANWTIANSAVVTVTVANASTSIGTPSITSPAAPPYTYAGQLTFAATVTPAGGFPAVPALTGSINFYDNGVLICSAVPSSATGVATCSNVLATPLVAGSHTITAQFAGDANYGSSATSAALAITINKATPTFSAPAAFTATYGGLLSAGGVTVNTTANGAIPTGTVTLTATAGNIPFAGTFALAGGVATVTNAQLPTALSPVVASNLNFNYSGDSNYLAGTTAGTITVTKAVPAVTLVSSQNPSALSQSVTFTATVTTPTTGTPTGTFTFMDGAATLASGVPIVAGSATYTTTALTSNPPTNHPITAVYSGDTNFTGPTSNTVTQVVASAATAIVLTPSSINPALNSVVTYSVTITGGTTPPQGAAVNAVIVNDGATAVCTISGASLVVGASSTSGSCTVNYNNTGVNIAGTHNMTAVFAPLNANWTAATSPVVTVTVVNASTTIGTPSSSAGTTYTYATPTTFSVTVSPTTANPVLTGVVKFYDGGTLIATSGVPVAGTGVATAGASVILAAGTHTITAQYAGDPNYGSSPVSANLAVTVNKATPTFSSPGSFTAIYGGLLSAGGVTVNTTAGGVTPTGTVNLTATAGNIPFAATFTLAGGVATVTNAQLPTALSPVVGGALNFNYSGDSNYLAGTTAGTITVTKAVPAVTLVSSQNPSALNQSVTLTATVTTPTTGTPTGTFTFMDGAATLASGVPIVAGSATFTTTALTSNPPTNHPITAIYSGDTNFTNPTSNTVTQIVNSGVTVIVLTPSSLNPSLNSVVTYSVTITGGTTPPQGAAVNAVIVNDGATAVCTISGASLVVGASSTSGSCTVNYNNTGVNIAGTHNMTAVFAPLNANWTAATSPVVTVTVVNASTTIGTPSSSAGTTYTYATPTTFSATVAPNVANPNYTGLVKFYDNGTQVASGIPNSTTGIAVATTPVIMLAGSHTITAQFAGDANYGSSPVSANLNVTVNKATPTFSAPGSFTAIYGGLLSAGGVTVNTTAGGVTPTGTVTLTATAGNIPFAATFTLAGGVATVTNTQLPTALSPVAGGALNFNYSGDSNYLAGSVSGTITVTIATPTVTLVSSQNPSSLNQSVTFTATVTTPTTGTPTGTFTFRDGATILAANVPITGGAATYTTSALTVNPPNTHNITAQYNGDTNFITVTSAILNQIVNAGNTTITLTPSSLTPSLNDVVTYSVTVQGGVTPPQGSVVVSDGATGVCSIAAVTVGTNSSTGSCTVTYNASDAAHGVGPHVMSAAFTTANANWSNATSAAVNVTVGKGKPTMSPITVTPSVASSCLPNICVPYGTTFTFSVTMTPANPSAVYQAGVQYTDNSVPIGAAAAIGVPSGVATKTNVLLTGGTHLITATFPGDANWLPDPQSVTITIGPMSGTGFITAGGTFAINTNPVITTYVGAIPQAPQGPITVALVPPAGLAVPTGTVTLSVGAVTLGTFNLSGGVATVTIGQLPAALQAGNGQTLTVTYNGDGNYSAGNTPATNNINVAKANAIVNLGASPNPSNFNQNVVFTVTAASPAPVGLPTGNVNILDGAAVISAPAILLANGTGTFGIASLTTGAHNITAAYLGDNNFNAFTTSPALVQTVTAGNTNITVNASNSTPAMNSAVVYTFTVTGGSAPPVGTISMTDSITGAAVTIGECANLAVVAVPAPPLNTSTVTCTVSYNNSNAQHGAGVHQLVATFTSGNTANWANVTSSTVTVTAGKAATSVAQPTSSAGATFAYGTNTTFSAVVTPTTAVPNYAINTVQFYDNGTPLDGPRTPSSTTGIATVTTTTPLTAGSHTITAQFIGDANYSASTVSPNFVVTVTKATPNPVTLTAPAPAYITTYGGLLTTGVANVPLVGAGGIPTGTVTLSSGAVVIATGTLDGSGNYTFTNVQMPASINVGAGQNLTVTYNGDANYTAATFVSGNGLTVNAATSTAKVTSAPLSPVGYGQNVAFTVTLTGPGNPANGTISFTSDGLAINATCTAPAQTLTANIATCTVAAITANNLSAGSHIITVTNFTEPNGNHVLGTVTPLNPFVVGPPAPQIVITSSQNPSVYGQTVTFTAIASGPTGAPAPSGQLQFFDGNGTIGALQQIASTSGSSVTYTLTVPSGSIPTLSGGTHAISATYVALTPGNVADPNYSNGTSQTQVPPSVLQQVVNRAPSQTVNNAAALPVVASVNITPSASVYGQGVTFTADVIPATGNVGTPTGIVIFKDNGVQFGPAVTLQAVGLIQRAQLPLFTGLSRGAHGITAEYQGDTNFNASTTASTPLTVDYDNTKTILSTLPASPTFGAQITLTAQVCGLVAGSATLCNGALAVGPSSTITFFDGSTALGTSGPVDGTGTGSISIVMQNPPFTNAPGGSSPIGTHVITARYNGHGSPSGDDNNFNQSTSAAQNLVIGKAVTNSSVASNANPSVTGQTIRFTALISAPGSFATPPTGTVQFVDGSLIIGSAPVTTNGGVSSAILDVPSNGVTALTVGQHVISVQYSGDNTYAASNSPLVAPTALVQVVNKAATTTTISSSANSATVGQQVTLTAIVTVNAPGGGTPSGSVQFVNLSAPNQPTVLGTSPLVVTPGPNNANQFMATLVLSTLPQGNPSIVAIYSGDPGYLTSTSAPMIQSVNKTPVNITLTSSKSPSILGDQVTFAITVAPIPPGTGTPTGQVTIYDGTDQIGQFTLQGGQYNFVTTGLLVGNHAIGVQYVGDTNFQAFNSPTILQIVSKIPTSLALTSNAPTAIASQIITFTAVLSPNPIPGVTFASGQVGFYDGANLMGVTNLQSNVATINVANLSTGLHQISAVYIGDDRWSGASSGFYAQTIQLASTSTQIVSSANPAVYGQPITFTMSVAVPFPGTVPAVGQVQLYDNNNAVGDPINSANGQFSITIPLFSPGQHSIVARFLANGSFSASQSATLPQVVNKAPTVTTLAVQPNGSTSKQQVSMTAVVTVPPPSLFGLPTAPPLNANLPTGSVQFVDTTFNKVLGTAPIALVGGVYTATLVTDQLTQSGSPQILTATYSGDGYFASSTSGPIGQSVFGTQISAVNGASYTGSNFAPDSWVTIFGDNLSSGQLTAVTTPYPTSLAGTTVSIVDANGTTKLMPLYFVSAGQINALIPTNTAFGLATVTVTNPQGATASTIILITRTAPGIFSANASGAGVAAALIQRVRPDNSQAIENVATYDSATNKMVATPITAGNDSLYLQLYGTGIRYTPTLSKVTCTIGGKDATVLYASAAPGFYGLDQINVQVPSGLSGIVNVVVTVDGQAANTVTLTFK